MQINLKSSTCKIAAPSVMTEMTSLCLAISYVWHHFSSFSEAGQQCQFSRQTRSSCPDTGMQEPGQNIKMVSLYQESYNYLHFHSPREGLEHGVVVVWVDVHSEENCVR